MIVLRCEYATISTVLRVQYDHDTGLVKASELLECMRTSQLVQVATVALIRTGELLCIKYKTFSNCSGSTSCSW